MATITLVTGDISTANAALVAATVDTVNFGDDCDMVEVLNVDGLQSISFTVDKSTPTSGAKNTYFVQATAGAALEVTVPTGGNTVVKLISTGSPTYKVTRTS